jgi:uncharacterized phage-like protein YoqJ
MIVAGTGHRPDHLGSGGYGGHVARCLQQLAVAELSALQPRAVITGMAVGWDQALARAAIELGLPFHAYVPFVGQERLWPAKTKEAYHALLTRAATVVICSPGGYSAYKMQVRNERMVDDCDTLLALWDGTAGGTANCVAYAKRVERRIENCWPRFKR